MFLNNLFEALDQRHAAFCFGRMNPPTEGHQQLINTVVQQGRGSNFFIFTSQSQDPKKNPLDYQTKVRFLRALYPGIASHIVYDTNLKTIMQVAAWLYNKGFRSVTFVAGGDRLDDFKELLTKYNGLKGGAVYYNFDNIQFVSSGERDPDSEGVAGVSASAARAAAAAGDYNAFSQAVGAGKITRELYNAVRKGMNISDELNEYAPDGSISHGEQVNEATVASLEKKIQAKKDALSMAEEKRRMRAQKGGSGMRTQSDRETKLRADISRLQQELHSLKSVNECSGYIPKNKKEAKDPRWSNALSVDVNPDTPNKNLRAFKL